jgi:hypothetical protein
MPRGLKSPSCQYDSIHQHKYLSKWKIYSHMTFSIKDWDTQNDRLCVVVCKGGEIIEHTNGKCHVSTF